MIFYITFVLALFHNKKCCNFINLFPCILWNLIVMSFRFKLVKIAQDSENSPLARD